MIRILLSLLIMGAPVMAKDGAFQAPKATAPIDEEEAFWNSEEGRDISRLFEEFSSGKRTYDEAFDEYNKKWADKPLPQTPKQAPAAPYQKIR